MEFERLAAALDAEMRSLAAETLLALLSGGRRGRTGLSSGASVEAADTAGVSEPEDAGGIAARLPARISRRQRGERGLERSYPVEALDGIGGIAARLLERISGRQRGERGYPVSASGGSDEVVSESSDFSAVESGGEIRGIAARLLKRISGVRRFDQNYPVEVPPRSDEVVSEAVGFSAAESGGEIRGIAARLLARISGVRRGGRGIDQSYPVEAPNESDAAVSESSGFSALERGSEIRGIAARLLERISGVRHGKRGLERSYPVKMPGGSDAAVSESAGFVAAGDGGGASDAAAELLSLLSHGGRGGGWFRQSYPVEALPGQAGTGTPFAAFSAAGTAAVEQRRMAAAPFGGMDGSGAAETFFTPASLERAAAGPSAGDAGAVGEMARLRWELAEISEAHRRTLLGSTAAPGAVYAAAEEVPAVEAPDTRFHFSSAGYGAGTADMESVSDFFRRDSRRYDSGFAE